jgi:hypothetical protein
MIGSVGLAADVNQPLPLKRVVMLNSGVGYFEHVGKIDGNRMVEFPVKVDDINDLLKSLVVQDRGGGRVTAVNYGSPEPISNTLKGLAIDVTRNPSVAQILQQLRGQKVELSTASDTKPVLGIVVGVERRRLFGRDQQVIESDMVLLRTEAGLRTVAVDSITLTKFLDEKTDREFQQALDLLGESRKQDRKSVRLDFRGERPREVSVGYVQESPVWKTSYRLVLAEDKPPFLQGWAIVENTTAQDWTEVDLTLMSGRPISFQMDLYQPLFAVRPTAELEMHSSVGPRMYNQDLASREEEFRAAGDPANAIAGSSRRRSGGMGGMGGGMMGGMGGGMGGMGGGGGGFFAGGASTPGAVATPPAKPTPMDLASGVASAANTDDVGDAFRYVIKTPVTLRRNESAMLPIVNDPVKGDKVYIFNESVHWKHPLAGLRLKNSTELHLQQGPITVFEDDEYAGDAQIADIPPGSTRLISYAMDLDTEVVTSVTPEEKELVGLNIHSGGLILKNLATRKIQYVIKNSGARAKTLLIEQPIHDAWKNVSPQPAEKTRDLYRFTAIAEPGKPATVTVTETKDVEERIVLNTLNAEQIDLYIRLDQASVPVRNALKEFLRRKAALNDLIAKRVAVEKLIQDAVTEQSRLRDNLRTLGENDPLHQRFVQKLAASEDTLEKLRPQLAAAHAEETPGRKDFEKFAADLTAE